MQCMEYSKIWLNLTFAALNLTFIRGQKAFEVFYADHSWLKWNGWETLCYRFLLAFLDLLAQRSITFLSFWSYWPIVIICEQKQRIVQRSGSFQHNLRHYCFKLWCLPGFLVCLQSTFSIKTSSYLSLHDCKPWFSVTLQRKIRDCSQSVRVS